MHLVVMRNRGRVEPHTKRAGAVYKKEQNSYVCRLWRSASSHDEMQKRPQLNEGQLQHHRLRPSAGNMFDRLCIRFCAAQQLCSRCRSDLVPPRDLVPPMNFIVKQNPFVSHN